MRRGYDPRVLLNDRNELMALATGSDACAEHECGIRPLQSALTSQYDGRDDLVSRLRKGEPVDYPQLLDLKRIVKTPKELQFVEVPGTGSIPDEAFLAFSDSPVKALAHELSFFGLPTGRARAGSSRDLDIVGAWDQGSFAFRVRGTRYCAYLRELRDALFAGKALFGGSLIEASGVVLAIEDRLGRAERARIRVAQAQFESKLRLDARDESGRLTQEMTRLVKAAGRSGLVHIGFLWAEWADEARTEVAYALNPGYGIPAQYGGPYTETQLLDWARTGMAYPLRPLARAA